MITPELLDFLRSQDTSGTRREDLEHMLITEGGWEKADIDQAFSTLQIEEASSSASTSIRHTDAPSQILAVLDEDALEQLGKETVAETPEPVVLNVRREHYEPEALDLQEVQQEVQTAPTLSHQENFATGGGSPPSPQDDFLGIFDDHILSSQATPQEQSEQKASESLPAVNADPVQEIQTIEPEVYAPPILALENTSGVTPPVLPFVKPPQLAPRRSFQEMLAQVSAPATSEDPKLVKGNEYIALDTFKPIEKKDQIAPISSPEVRFNLSGLRRETAPPILQPINHPQEIREESPHVGSIEPGYLSSEKQMETKSVAELWLNKREEPGARGPILARRTMSSDILLRGKGAMIQGIPSVSVPPDSREQTIFREQQSQSASESKEREVSPPPPPIIPPIQSKAVTLSPLADDLLRKQKIKKIIGILVGVLILIIVLGVGIFAFTALRGPNIDALFTTTFTKFLSATSFVYGGSASSDLVLSATSDGVVRNGAVKFNLLHGGQLKNGSDGYGDGIHHIKFKGGLQSGNFKWSTDVESDVRMLGNSLYFHVLSFPPETGIDPEVFKAYWIKIDLEEIAKELALSGVATTQQGYGNFGSGSNDPAFGALLTKNLPFSGGEKLIDEPVNGVPVMHFRLKTDSEKMLALVNALFNKFTGKDMTLDSDQQLRLKNALAKISAEVWIDPTTSTLQKFSLKADLDDDIAGVHVKGPFAIDFTFSQFNASVSVPTPTPLLTLEELQSRMTDYRHSRGVRALDAQKLKVFTSIQDALALYQKDMGRYPNLLSELRVGGRLATSSADDITLKQYFYVAYIKPDLFTKANKCNAKSKVCAEYHLGVNLDDVTDPALVNDSDQTSDISGNDRAGCANEPNKACYDITFTAPVLPPALAQ